jgi:hypothetical protein
MDTFADRVARHSGYAGLGLRLVGDVDGDLGSRRGNRGSQLELNLFHEQLELKPVS